MAFVRVKKSGKHEYCYLAENQRQGGKVCQKTLVYLGPSPQCGTVAGAIAYWQMNLLSIRILPGIFPSDPRKLKSIFTRVARE